MRTDFEFDSFNEVKLEGHKWYSEDSQPRAIIVLSHGMAESILRYEAFAQFLVDNQFVVYGHSHRGHGQLAAAAGKLGYIGEDGWNKMVEDLKTVVDMAAKDFPGLPKVVYGHSMGSYVARAFLKKYEHEADAIVFSGTGFPSKMELIGAGTIAKIESVFNLKDEPSKRLDKLSFGKFNAQIKDPRTPFDWLSTVEEEVDKYIENPLCGQIHPTSFFVNFIDGLYHLLYKNKPVFNEPQIPVLVLSGSNDPCGECETGVMKTGEYYKNLGFDTEILLYPKGRHEMLNEANRGEVYEDVIAWINRKIEI
ncbi:MULTISPECIES: alpha/beta fold hydrolase [unclassified Fusibacter]|uniref:alpha/beta fold hydrolase n=1 Tax=unclassified Fusibacter TaxID=2624464 RepID=UPI0010135DB7|nr:MULTISPECIES: alpha/beta fold hydrolase [unclassified Fusibacter]MCK8060152.1 lysophospholipase [Fusibacter sp. A2]NPE22294.1 alpha/beta hydrolase [Fusibacter sp. A1]RXV61067.1 alpha/beta fold hydrolase [Fusibacter sp. A1]